MGGGNGKQSPGSEWPARAGLQPLLPDRRHDGNKGVPIDVLTRRHVLLGAAAALVLPAPSAAARKAGAAQAPEPKPGGPKPGELLLHARSWAYQLQNYDLRTLTASDADVLVVDYSISGDEQSRLTETTVRRLQQKPDGSRRVVLAYLSIGEAEEYRYYWDKDWIESEEPIAAASPGKAASAATGKQKAAGAEADAAKPSRWLSPKAPAWLGDENESWSGNFAVKYWEPGWQSLIVGTPGCYVDRIVAAGFDGVYLDRVDAFYEHTDARPAAADEMVSFVGRIGEHARAKKAGFLLVPQNGEELLMRPGYVDLIDAIAKEDLMFGSPEQGQPNSPAQIANTVGWLSQARIKNKPVLVVEYVDGKAEIEKARREITNLGYVATFGPRMLDAISADAVQPER